MVNSPQNPRQDLDLTSFSTAGGEPVEWRISDAPVPYPEAVAAMEARVAGIVAGEADDSPGLQLIGVLLIVGAIALGVRIARHRK